MDPAILGISYLHLGSLGSAWVLLDSPNKRWGQPSPMWPNLLDFPIFLRVWAGILKLLFINSVVVIQSHLNGHEK